MSASVEYERNVGSPSSNCKVHFPDDFSPSSSCGSFSSLLFDDSRGLLKNLYGEAVNGSVLAQQHSHCTGLEKII